MLSGYQTSPKQRLSNPENGRISVAAVSFGLVVLSVLLPLSNALACDLVTLLRSPTKTTLPGSAAVTWTLQFQNKGKFTCSANTVYLSRVQTNVRGAKPVIVGGSAGPKKLSALKPGAGQTIKFADKASPKSGTHNYRLVYARRFKDANVRNHVINRRISFLAAAPRKQPAPPRKQRFKPLGVLTATVAIEITGTGDLSGVNVCRVGQDGTSILPTVTTDTDGSANLVVTLQQSPESIRIRAEKNGSRQTDDHTARANETTSFRIALTDLQGGGNIPPTCPGAATPPPPPPDLISPESLQRPQFPLYGNPPRPNQPPQDPVYQVPATGPVEMEIQWAPVFNASHYRVTFEWRSGGPGGSTDFGVRVGDAIVTNNVPGTRHTQRLTPPPIALNALNVVWKVQGCVSSGCGPAGYQGFELVPQDPLATWEAIADTFRAPACVNCHALIGAGSISSVVPNHPISANNPTPGNPDDPDDDGCNTCHLPAFSVEGNLQIPWHAAPEEMSLNPAGPDTDRRNCQERARNFGGAANSVLQHLTQDSLILWAVKGGQLPQGLGNALPAFGNPGDTDRQRIDAWRSAVNAWFSAGMPCPQ